MAPTPASAWAPGLSATRQPWRRPGPPCSQQRHLPVALVSILCSFALSVLGQQPCQSAGEKILGYSSIFGDVAPSQPKAISRKPSGKGKGGKKRAQGDGRWKGRGAAGLTRPSADSASPGATHLHDPLNPRSRQQMPVDVTRRQPGCSQPTSLHG